MKSLNPIGRVIRFLRKEEHVSQAELARAVGVTQPTVSSWEHNRTRASAEQEAEIFRYLGLSDREVLLTFRTLIDEALEEITKFEERRGPLSAFEELEAAVESSELSMIKREGFKNLLAAIKTDQFSVMRRISDFKIFFHAITTESAEPGCSGNAEKTLRNPE